MKVNIALALYVHTYIYLYTYILYTYILRNSSNLQEILVSRSRARDKERDATQVLVAGREYALNDGNIAKALDLPLNDLSSV